VSDLSASVEQEVRKDGTVLASLARSPHRKEANPQMLQLTQREPQAAKPEAPSVL